MKKIKVIIILQARCGSKRFPFKSLYPINGLPLVIYCAKRLMGNEKYKLIIATSKKKIDNEIAKLAKNNKINFFRGSEKNVLKRFKDIVKNYKKNDIVIRATADNPLPDSSFLDQSLSIFNKHKLDYFVTNNEYFRIPYGLNLEILKVKMIRRQKHNKLNNEHVTFSLRKKFKLNNNKEKFTHEDFSKYNFSIDYVQDYLRIKKQLEKFKINTNWLKILKKMT